MIEKGRGQLKEAIQEFILNTFGFLPQELLVVIISALPILELRGGIPLAAYYGFSYWEAFFYGVLGNLLPIIPLLLFFQPISRWMLRFSWYEKFYHWLFDRAKRKSKEVQKYGAIGLTIFTAVPFPTTGAYTACLLAMLFFIRVRVAFIAISAGVIIAGIGVTLVVYSIF